jgi:hypothetical protein
MMRYYLISRYFFAMSWLFLCALPLLATDNPWTLLKRVPIKGFACASGTRNAQLVLADAQGLVTMYDTLGLLQQQLSTEVAAKPSGIEAWNSLQIMLFFSDLQKIIYADRFLLAAPTIDLPSSCVGLARVATSAPDNNIWLIDDNDFSLKKVNLAEERILLQVPLNSVLSRKNTYNFCHIREYQHHVYLADKTHGVFVFDNMGNYRKQMPFINGNLYGFANDELYYWDEKNQTINFFHLYSLAEKKIAIPQEAKEISYFFLNGKYAAFVTKTEILFYKKNP